jgi:predicted ArsR family transcriptional regulator
MKKTLTHRQQQFLVRFLNIYKEMNQSVHYIAVAERFGIGKVTAYEMLRLLEDRGLVHAEYQTGVDQHGPGRAAVLFYPTQEAHKLIAAMAGETTENEDWHSVKERILQQLRAGKAGGYENLLSELLLRIQEHRSPLIFVTELTTTVFLMLTTLMEKSDKTALM